MVVPLGDPERGCLLLPVRGVDGFLAGCRVDLKVELGNEATVKSTDTYSLEGRIG
jgi:hypothetical protein